MKASKIIEKCERLLEDNNIEVLFHEKEIMAVIGFNRNDFRGTLLYPMHQRGCVYCTIPRHTGEEDKDILALFSQKTVDAAVCGFLKNEIRYWEKQNTFDWKDVGFPQLIKARYEEIWEICARVKLVRGELEKAFAEAEV